MEDMNELKEMVLKKMQDNGVLGQLKAQMRAKVFDIIDQQEKTNDNLSALYLNNPKIQSAKKNKTALQAMEIFVEFLDFYKLQNTKEIFSSETNFSYNQEIKKDLKDEYSQQDQSIAQQVYKRWKQGPQTQPSNKKKDEKKNKQKNRQSYKSQMEDLQKKSEKLDLLIQSKNQQLQEQEEDDDEIEQEIQEINTKQSEIEKSPIKKKDLFKNLQLKEKINLNTNSSQNSKLRLKKSLEKLEEKFINASNKESIQSGLMQNESERQDTDNVLISESHGYDVTVDTVALEDFDYIESINESMNEQQLNQMRIKFMNKNFLKRQFCNLVEVNQNKSMQIQQQESVNEFCYRIAGMEQIDEKKFGFIYDQMLGFSQISEEWILQHLQKIYFGSLYSIAQKDKEFLNEYLESNFKNRLYKQLDFLDQENVKLKVEDDVIGKYGEPIENKIEILDSVFVQGLSTDRQLNGSQKDYHIHNDIDEMVFQQGFNNIYRQKINKT